MSYASMNQYATIALQVLAAGTAVAVALRGAIPLLHKLAQSRRNKRLDDEITALDHGLDTLIQVLDVARRVIPRVVIGPLPSTQPIARSLPPPATPGAEPAIAPIAPVVTLSTAPSRPSEPKDPHV